MSNNKALKIGFDIFNGNADLTLAVAGHERCCCNKGMTSSGNQEILIQTSKYINISIYSIVNQMMPCPVIKDAGSQVVSYTYFHHSTPVAQQLWFLCHLLQHRSLELCFTAYLVVTDPLFIPYLRGRDSTNCLRPAAQRWLYAPQGSYSTVKESSITAEWVPDVLMVGEASPSLQYA